MALKLLDGPNPLVWESGMPIKFRGEPFWVDEYGLYGTVYLRDYEGIPAFFDHLWGVVCVAQYDGRTFPRNNIAWRQTDTYVYDQPTEGLLAWSDYLGYSAYSFDTLIGRPIQKVNSYSTPRYIRLNDRWLTIEVRGTWYDRHCWVRSYGFDQTPDDTITEFEFTMDDDFNPTGKCFVSPGVGGVLHAVWESGHIVVYNPYERRQINRWQHLGMTTTGCWYSKKLNAYISRHVDPETGQDELRVWANETEIEHLSQPEALTPITKGQITTLRVRAQGAQMEPAGGKLLNWSVTVGPGAMITAQSTTDADGYAEARYVAPVDNLDPVTIKVEGAK